MYQFLLRYMKPRRARILLVLWYTTLVIAMYLLSFENDPGFLYLDL